MRESLETRESARDAVASYPGRSPAKGYLVASSEDSNRRISIHNGGLLRNACSIGQDELRPVGLSYPLSKHRFAQAASSAQIAENIEQALLADICAQYGQKLQREIDLRTLCDVITKVRGSLTGILRHPKDDRLSIRRASLRLRPSSLDRSICLMIGSISSGSSGYSIQSFSFILRFRL